MDDENLKWMRASEVFDRFVADRVLPHDASLALATLLREGKIRARARALGETKEALLKNAWKKVRTEPGYQPIPATFWRGNRYFDEDRAHWVWKMSRFHSTLRKDPWKRKIARQVQFCVQDLAKVRPEAFQDAMPKKRRGRPPELEKRDAIWNAVFDIVIEAHTDEMVWTDRTEFSDAVHQRLKLPGGKRRAGESATNLVIGQAFPKLEKLRGRIKSSQSR